MVGVPLTVPEAARRVERNPETVRRWIREGKLPARKLGSQHFIEQADLEKVTRSQSHSLPLPKAWQRTRSGAPMPDVVEAVVSARRQH